MTTTIQTEYDRITFSLPSSINSALEKLKSEVSRSKSELIKLAIENYLEQEKKNKLQKAVEMMASEYENDAKFTEFTSLDSEAFS